MNKKKAQNIRTCYTCREKAHMANQCPKGNSPKPISIDENIMLRKDGNGTSNIMLMKDKNI
jgi:hypothetical protein